MILVVSRKSVVFILVELYDSCQAFPLLTNSLSICCDRRNGSNECSLSGGSECLLGNSFLAAVAGTGSSCTTNSVSVGITATPPGCGCTPNRAAPCTFDGSKKQADLSCFICDANDLAAGECPACNVCLGNSNNCANTSITVVKFESCLASISTDDRNDCKGSCTKW